jgi:hypothetical protein
MPKINRLEVNAAIARLIGNGENWEQNAKTIIENCHDLPWKKGAKAEITKFGGKTNNKSITGYIAGHGNITIKDEKPASRVRQWQFGFDWERVGQFKIRHATEGLLIIKHFWKDEIGTRDPSQQGPKEYYLIYDPKSLKPLSFAVKSERLIFHFWFIRHIEIIQHYLELLSGEPPKQPVIGYFINMYKYP